MRYLLMIYNNDVTWADFDGPGRAQFDASHGALIEELVANGELIETNALDQVDAKIVRTPDGSAPVVTDGPYAETKEFVGGFYLIDVADEARAIAIAARLREADTSLIEVRRLVVDPADITGTEG